MRPEGGRNVVSCIGQVTQFYPEVANHVCDIGRGNLREKLIGFVAVVCAMEHCPLPLVTCNQGVGVKVIV